MKELVVFFLLSWAVAFLIINNFNDKERIEALRTKMQKKFDEKEH